MNVLMSSLQCTSSVAISFDDGLSSMELVNEVGEYVFVIMGRTIGSVWLAFR